MDELARGLGSIAATYGIRIQTCGTNGDFSRYGIQSSGCMTLDILGEANGVTFKNRKHKGMRQGCHCIEKMCIRDRQKAARILTGAHRVRHPCHGRKKGTSPYGI